MKIKNKSFFKNKNITAIKKFYLEQNQVLIISFEYKRILQITPFHSLCRKLTKQKSSW